MKVKDTFKCLFKCNGAKFWRLYQGGRSRNGKKRTKEREIMVVWGDKGTDDVEENEQESKVVTL